MLARYNRHFCKQLISSTSCLSRSHAHSTITSRYRRSSKFTCSPLIGGPTRCLHFSRSFYREVDTATMSDEGSRKALNVNYEQLLEAQKNDKVLIVDVREQSEINETGKLPGSIHIPMGDVSNILLNLTEDDFKNRYGRHKPTKDAKIIFSCRSGTRSAKIQEAVQKLGYKNAYNYTGGWIDWESKQKA